MPAIMRSILTVSVLSLLLAACTVTFLPDEDNGSSGIVERPRPTPPPPPVVERPRELPRNGVIDRFQTASNTLNPGSVLTFRTRTREDGFVTITAMAPDGRVTVFMRATRINPNRETLIPSAGSLQASTPHGTWRVRAHFSSSRPAGVSFEGLQGEEAWTQAILRDLQGVDLADVVETNYEVQTR